MMILLQSLSSYNSPLFPSASLIPFEVLLTSTLHFGFTKYFKFYFQFCFSKIFNFHFSFCFHQYFILANRLQLPQVYEVCDLSLICQPMIKIISQFLNAALIFQSKKCHLQAIRNHQARLYLD